MAKNSFHKLLNFPSSVAAVPQQPRKELQRWRSIQTTLFVKFPSRVQYKRRMEWRKVVADDLACHSSRHPFNSASFTENCTTIKSLAICVKTNACRHITNRIHKLAYRIPFLHTESPVGYKSRNGEPRELSRSREFSVNASIDC